MTLTIQNKIIFKGWLTEICSRYQITSPELKEELFVEFTNLKKNKVSSYEIKSYFSDKGVDINLLDMLYKLYYYLLDTETNEVELDYKEALRRIKELMWLEWAKAVKSVNFSSSNSKLGLSA